MWKKLGDVLQAIGAVIAVMLTIVFSIMISAIPIAIAILFVLWVLS